MLHSCAEYLTHTLYRHCPLSEEKRPVLYTVRTKLINSIVYTFHYFTFYYI